MKHQFWMAIFVFCFVSTLAYASESRSSELQAFPEAVEGLKSQMETLLLAAEQGDSEVLLAQTKNLVMASPEEWFREVFGTIRGTYFAEQYQQIASRVPEILAQELHQAVSVKLTRVEVKQFKERCEMTLTSQEYPALRAMIKVASLYRVQFLDRSGQRGKVLRFLVYRDGAFRYVGSLQIAPEDYPLGGVEVKSDSQAQRSPMRIEAPVQQSRRVESDRPRYPDRAKAMRIQGTVRFLALIDREGNVKHLELVEGHCWLVDAAEKALRRWRYTPTLVDGQPVEVITTLQVVYTLRQ